MKKRLNLITISLSLMLCTLFLTRCVDNEATEYQNTNAILNLPSEPYEYSNLNLDSKFSFLDDKVNQSVTDHGATLGRVLFYDTKLSLNNKVSCASCHQQKFGFADNKDFSLGFDGRKSLRNSHSLCNTAINSTFFWDGRETKMNNLVLQPVRDHIEMGLDNTLSLENRIKAVPYYKDLFENAFNSTEITAARISEALAQFVNSMVSVDAPVNEIDGDPYIDLSLSLPSHFSDEQKKGAELFFGKAKCSSCHAGSSMHFSSSTDIGLENDYTGKDSGQGQITPGREGIFNIPSLVNVELTAPYMHDGRFKTLEEVIDHYNSGIKNSKNLNWLFIDQTNNEPIRLNLSSSEKKSLIAFLSTFTDSKMIEDPKYSDPFRR
jgi:cytochrome c peroxidase